MPTHVVGYDSDRIRDLLEIRKGIGPDGVCFLLDLHSFKKKERMDMLIEMLNDKNITTFDLRKNWYITKIGGEECEILSKIASESRVENFWFCGVSRHPWQSEMDALVSLWSEKVKKFGFIITSQDSDKTVVCLNPVVQEVLDATVVRPTDVLDVTVVCPEQVVQGAPDVSSSNNDLQEHIQRKVNEAQDGILSLDCINTVEALATLMSVIEGSDIHTIDLSDSQLSFNEEANRDRLCTMIKRNCNLQEVIVSDTDLSQRDLINAASQINREKICHTLLSKCPGELDIHNIVILKALSNGALKDKRVHTLCLKFSDIKTPAAIELLRNVLRDSNVHTLASNERFAEGDAVSTLLEILRLNEKIQNVSLDYTALSQDTKDSIDQAVSHNQQLAQAKANMAAQTGLNDSEEKSKRDSSGRSVTPALPERQPEYFCKQVLSAIKDTTKLKRDPIFSKGIVSYLKETLPTEQQSTINRDSQTPISAEQVKNTLSKMSFSGKYDTVMKILNRDISR